MATSANLTVVNGTSGSITDSNGYVWAINSNEQVTVNNVIDNTTSVVTELAYVDGKVWQENAAGLWWEKAKPSDTWFPNNGSSFGPYFTIDGGVLNSNQGSPSGFSLVENSDTSIGLQIAYNGVVDETTRNVTFLTSVNGELVQENVAGNWYAKTSVDGAWAQVSDPFSPLNTEVNSISGSIDFNGTTLSLVYSSNPDRGLQVAYNGKGDQSTQQVTLLAVVNGQIVQENAYGNWYAENQPDGSWTQISKPTFEWKAAVSGFWRDITKWNPSGTPFISVGGLAEAASQDPVIFDTGSKTAYTVSGNGIAGNITVSQDIVIFDNFTAGDGYGEGVTIDHSANVTLNSNSSFNLVSHDDYATSSVTISDATLNVAGSISGDVDVKAYGTLNVTGQLKIWSNFTIEQQGTVHFSNSAQFSDSGIFNGINDISGTVELSGQTIDPLISPGGEVDGYGTISGANNGRIVASGGTLRSTATGTGSYQIDQQSTLELAANTSNNVAFLTDAMLKLDSGISESGFLQGVTTGDSVTLSGVTATSATATVANGNTTLTFYDNSTGVGSLHFAGNYSSSNLYLEESNGSLSVYYSTSTHPAGVLPITSS